MAISLSLKEVVKMSNLTELVLAEKLASVESAKQRIEMAARSMEWASNLDPVYVEECVEMARLELEIPDDLKYSFYMFSDRMDVDFGTTQADYDAILMHDDAALNWNGNWIKVERSIEYNGVTVNLVMEARVPDEVDALLRACGKIEDVQSTQKQLLC